MFLSLFTASALSKKLVVLLTAFSTDQTDGQYCGVNDQVILGADSTPRVLLDRKNWLCSFGTLRSISRKSHAPTEVVDGGFEQHFSELKPPAPRTHGSAERALDA